MAKQRKRQKKRIASSKAEGDGLPIADVAPDAASIGRDSRSIGKLWAILRMPMDVFVEIASFLEPIDILQLARTSKDLRETLMSKQSQHIWRISWANVSVAREVRDSEENETKTIPGYIPTCPPGMSEPLLVALMFKVEFCTACGRKTSRGSDLYLRVRECRNCPVAGLQYGERLLSKMRNEMRVIYGDNDDVLFSMVPSQKPRTWLTPRSASAADERNVNNWQTLSKNRFASAAFKEIARRYYKLLLARDKDLDKFIEERQKDVQELWKQTEGVAEYIEYRNRDQDRINRELSKSFRLAVHEELFKLGYRRDEFRLDRLWQHERDEFDVLDFQPRVLTARIWDKVRPKLEALLKHNRKKVHEADLLDRRFHIIDLVEKKLSQLTDDEGKAVDGRTYVMQFLDDLDFSPLTKFLGKKERDPEYDNINELPEEDWSLLVRRGFRGLIERRRGAAARAILHLLIRGVSELSVGKVCNLLDELDGPSSDSSIESLVASRSEVVVPAGFNIHHPAAFFFCSEENSPLEGGLCSFDDIYVSLGLCRERFDELMISTQRPPGKEYFRKNWVGDRRGMRIAMMLLDDLGYAPAGANGVQVSMLDMLSKDAVFACMGCPEDRRTKWGWRTLVQHFYNDESFAVDMSDQSNTCRPPDWLVGKLAIETESAFDELCPHRD